MSSVQLKSQMLPHANDLSVEAVIALIDEMIAVVEKENEQLARGLPARLSTLVSRKAQLASQFERCVALVKEQRVKIPAKDIAQRDRLAKRTAVLRDRMTENIERLQTAMEASRRRVEAVMSAIRQHVAEESPYSARGKAMAPRVINGSVYRQV